MIEVNWAEINDKAKEFFDKKYYQEAVNTFGFSLAKNLGNVPQEILVNYAKCLYYNKQADKSLQIVDYVLSENPTHETLIDKALYLNALGKHREASDILKNLENQDDHKVKFNLGWHLLRDGQFQEGFKNLQFGSSCRAWGNEYLYIEKEILDPRKRWDGKSAGHLLYVLEGGLGDQIIFFRWAYHLIFNFNCTITIVCHKSLIRLLVNAGYNCIPENEIQFTEYDYYIPAMSYPAISNNALTIDSPTAWVKDKIIDVHVDKYYNHHIYRYLKYHGLDQHKPRIGIKWFGNPEFEHDQMRTIPKDKLVEITSRYGHLFSFQFEDDDPTIPNVATLIRDWMDTYSMIDAMDIIVTSCTSIAHLAGSMGKRCIVIVPLVPYFTWASDDMKWYGDHLTVIRQTQYNDWTDAFRQLDEILKNEIR